VIEDLLIVVVAQVTVNTELGEQRAIRSFCGQLPFRTETMTARVLNAGTRARPINSARSSEKSHCYKFPLLRELTPLFCHLFASLTYTFFLSPPEGGLDLLHFFHGAIMDSLARYRLQKSSSLCLSTVQRAIKNARRFTIPRSPVHYPRSYYKEVPWWLSILGLFSISSLGYQGPNEISSRNGSHAF